MLLCQTTISKAKFELSSNTIRTIMLFKITTTLLQPFLFPYCLTAGPHVPLSCSQWALTPSCHSEADGFIDVALSHNPVSPSAWCLSIPAHIFSPCFAEPGQIPQPSSGPFSPLSPLVSSPNSPRPLFAPFPFFSLSLLRWTTHYPLSAFLILSPISHCLSPLISHFLLPLCISLCRLLTCTFFYFTDLNQTLHCVPIRWANTKG